MNYAQLYGLQPADRLTEPIFQTGLSQHHVIYLGADAQGVEWISENYKFKGVRLVRASAYFRPGKKFRVHKFSGNDQQREAAVRRALSLVGAPYNLIDFNCEHYAEFVQTGKSGSKQVDWVKNLFVFALFVLLIGSLTYAIANSKKSK
ncbi:MAG: lecithin retinol acyltransferase family protein [Chitinophagaceae bacterium]|nr:lecithin retinol acyltransferase family protein [Chitinophagaceae bacterium]